MAPMTPSEILCEAAHYADAIDPEVGGVLEAILAVNDDDHDDVDAEFAARICWGKEQRWHRWTYRDRITASLLAAAAEMLAK